MKKAIAAFFALAVLALVVVYLRLGAIAKNVVESYGPKITGAPVKVGAIIVSPFSGKARVTKLVIGNPAGFHSESAFRLNDVQVRLDLKSLTGGGPLRVHEILIDGPELTFEAGTSGSNLSRIQKNVEAYSPSEPKEKAEAQRKVEIGLVRVTNGKVTAMLPQLRQPPIEKALPDLELRDIGKKGEGATVAEAGKQIIGAMASAAVKASGGAEELLKRGAQALGGEAGKSVDKVRGLLFKKKK